MLRRTFSLLCISALFAVAHAQAPSIEVREARAPATPPGTRVAAVYFEVTAREDDTLMGASTPAASKAEIHETSEEAGVMKMRPSSAVKVAAGRAVKLQPGGLHLMLLGLERPLQAGERFPLTLHFAKAGDVRVEVHVVAPGDAHSHHHH